MLEKIPKPETKRKQTRRSQEMADIILGHPEFNYKDIEAPTSEETREKFNQRAREIFSKIDVVVHGMGKKVETGKEKQRGDIDGESALGLLRLAGILDPKKVKYIAKGESVPGTMHIDTGNRNGIIIEKEKDGTTTIYFDHHSPEFTLEPTSATQLLYEGLTAADLLKEEPYLDKLVEFVTQVDNLSYPENYYEKYPDYDKMLIGLWSHIKFAHLEQFFKDGKNPTDILIPEEIKKYGLQETAKAQKINIERALKVLPEIEKDGLIIETDKYGKIVVDIGGRLRPAGTIPSKYYGCDGYINWDSSNGEFFITVPGQDIDENFSQGIKVRGSMWLKPLDDPSPRTITLTEILTKLSEGKLNPTGKLKKYLDTEKTSVYNKDTVAEIKKTPEKPKSQVVEKLLDDLDRSLADKANTAGLDLKDYDLAMQELDKARDLNLTNPKEALDHLLLSDLLMDIGVMTNDLYDQKIKELETEQGERIPTPEPSEPIPDILGDQPRQVEPAPTGPETETKIKTETRTETETKTTGTEHEVETETEVETISPAPDNTARLAEIDQQINEINKRLSEEVLKWSEAQKLKQERENLWTEKGNLLGHKLEEEEKWSDEQIDRFIKANGGPAKPLGIEKAYWEDLKKKRAERAAGREGIEPAEESEKIKLDLEQKEIELKKIEYMIFNAKATAKSRPGTGPEGLAYWQGEWDKKAAEIEELENKLSPAAKPKLTRKRKPALVTENPSPEVLQPEPARPDTEPPQPPTPEPAPNPSEITQTPEPPPTPEPTIEPPSEPMPDILGDQPIESESKPEPSPIPIEPESQETKKEQEPGNFDFQYKTIASEEHPDINEDAVFVKKDEKIFGILDGVGGYAAGNIASREAAKYIIEGLQKLPEGLTPQETQNELKRILLEANIKLLNLAEKNPELAKMGSTASVVKIYEGPQNEKKAIIGNVGDSRVYILRDGQLKQITLDDSVVREKIEDEEQAKVVQEKLNNAIDPEILSDLEKILFARRNQITQALGRTDIEPRMHIIDVQENDKLIVTSDGIHDNLTDKEILNILNNAKNNQEAVENLTNAAINRSHESHPRAKSDDMSAIVFEYRMPAASIEGPPEEPEKQEKKKVFKDLVKKAYKKWKGKKAAAPTPEPETSTEAEKQKEKRKWSILNWFKNKIKESPDKLWAEEIAKAIDEFIAAHEKNISSETYNDIRDKILEERKGNMPNKKEFEELIVAASLSRYEANSKRIKKLIQSGIDKIKNQITATRGEALAGKLLTPERVALIERELETRLNMLRYEMFANNLRFIAKLLREVNPTNIGDMLKKIENFNPQE